MPVAVNTASGVSALYGKTVVAIAAGDYHSLALCSDGTVAAWGYNSYGQLGDNTKTHRNAPVAVNTGTGISALYGKTVVAIAAGAYHSLALCSDGTVAAWGCNDNGQLGDNTTTKRHVPVAVNTARVPRSTARRWWPSRRVTTTAWRCARTAPWPPGATTNTAQLGDNTTTNRLVPVAVNTDSGISALYGKTVVAIAAGYCAQPGAVLGRHRGRLGLQRFGQLGDNTTTQADLCRWR